MVIAGSSSESCKRYKSNPTEWAGEKDREKGRKKNENKIKIKRYKSNPTEWAGKKEREKGRKKNEN